MNKLKIPLNFGSLAGILSFIIFMILYALNYNPLGNASWLDVWVPIVFIYLGVRKFREEEQEGYISYGKAFSNGLFISFIYASLHAILIFLFLNFVDPGVVERHISEIMESMEKLESFLGEEAYEKAMEQINKEQFTIENIAVGDFQGKVFFGIIISLIVAAFLKKSKPLFES